MKARIRTMQDREHEQLEKEVLRLSKLWLFSLFIQRKRQKMEGLLMRTQLKINGEFKDVEINNGEIIIIEPQKKTTGWEKVEYDKTYYYDSSGLIYDTKENICEKHTINYNNANYFSNMKLADNISRMQTLQRKMFRWQAENDIPIISKSNYKWCILYNSKTTPEIHVNVKLSDEGFLPCFSSKEKAKECIEVFKNELTWLFTEFRWRMDD